MSPFVVAYKYDEAVDDGVVLDLRYEVTSSLRRIRKIVADILMDMETRDRLKSGRGNAMLRSRPCGHRGGDDMASKLSTLEEETSVGDQPRRKR